MFFNGFQVFFVRDLINFLLINKNENVVHTYLYTIRKKQIIGSDLIDVINYLCDIKRKIKIKKGCTHITVEKKEIKIKEC